MTAASLAAASPSAAPRPLHERVPAMVEHLAHLLPTQGPITVFVHHNTLHAFEDRPFAEAVCAAADLYGRHPYLPEETYRAALAQGRITRRDLERELYELLEERGDWLIGRLGTRHELWMSMIGSPLREGTEAEVRWFIEETDALLRFRPEASAEAQQATIRDVRRWLLREESGGGPAVLTTAAELQPWRRRISESPIGDWTAAELTPLSLQLLWAVCRRGAALAEDAVDADGGGPAIGPADEALSELLIRFGAAFLDQGMSGWTLPNRHRGFLHSFVELLDGAVAPPAWLRRGIALLGEQTARGLDAAEIIAAALTEAGIAPEDEERRLRDELLKLPGWAGMLWQMETNAAWTAWPAPRGSLLEYLAVRLTLRGAAPPAAASSAAARPGGILNRAFLLFQIAQVRGWSAPLLDSLSTAEWRALFAEIGSFPSRVRRRVFHQAYERRYREETLDAVTAAATALAAQRPASPTPAQPAYQVMCCIDDREESLRRHLEEVDPQCETFGYAGFFGVAMYYRGVADANFRPLCPVNVIPQHEVVEEPAPEAAVASRRKAAARRLLGRVAHWTSRGSRTFVGGLAAGLLGAFAAAPLVARVLFPRLTALVRGRAGRAVADQQTLLQIEACGDGPTAAAPRRGYTAAEMATIVGSVLRATGLAGRLSPLVIVTGHGSTSVNNPHAAAYDCGACGGGRGGPNARAFARMANDPRVRELLAGQGVIVPGQTWFVGAYHDTCHDLVRYDDLDRLPPAVAELLARAQRAVDEARRRSAHERCRRFESASLALNPDEALRHVEGRAADLSQARPECGHATNALCLVGRRAWSRGLFLDRRAFLASYDPALDDDRRTILAGILGAVIPVCGGINLEYYFSRIDCPGYGCGTKLPHNVTSLLGVMDGAGSDLRTGLPWQMVEIHEPLRILFLIETSPAAMLRIMADSAAIDRLIRGGWVQAATLEFDAAGAPVIHEFVRDQFMRRKRPAAELPTVPTSAAWFRGQRDHLGFALLEPLSPAPPTTESTR